MKIINRIKFRFKRKKFVEARVKSYFIHTYKNSRYHIGVCGNTRYLQYGIDSCLEEAGYKLRNKSFVKGFFWLQKYAKKKGYYFTWR